MPRKSKQLELPLEQPSNSLFKVSQSKVKTYRRCRQAYHYKYVEELKRKRRPRALVFGTLVHQMIEADANGDDPFELLDQINIKDAKMFASEKEEYGEIIKDVGVIMYEYFQYWEKNDPIQYIRRKGRSAEHKFEIELFPDVIWNGKIDANARSKDGMRWLVEHKSFKRRPNADTRWRNLQSSTYIRAQEIMGWSPMDGICWDYIWSKSPGKPGLLKDGKMSQKNLETLPLAVTQAAKDYGLDPKDYREFKKKTESHRQSWFFRVKSAIHKKTVDAMFDDFSLTILDMVNNHGKSKEKNIDNHCSWCEFEPLCRAQLQGLDYEYVKEREYEKTTKNEDDSDAHSVSFEEL